MKYVAFVLNFPWTLAGLLSAIIYHPVSFRFDKEKLALIFKVKDFRFKFGYLKNSRARTVGNVVMLGPDVLKNDLEHELIHVDQNIKYPFIYPFLYYYEHLKHGYRNNKFEDEAFRLSNSVHNP